jgi:hypothetical protein
MEMLKKSRWQQLQKTSPSGKAMFVCLSCGVVTPSPSDTADCSAPVRVVFEGHYYSVPCSAWPKTPAEYIESEMLEHNQTGFFSGTIMLPEGTFQISVPVPETVARDIAVRSVDYALSQRSMKKDRNEHAKKLRELEAVTDELERVQKRLEVLKLQEEQYRTQAPYGQPSLPPPGSWMKPPPGIPMQPFPLRSNPLPFSKKNK